MINAKIPILGFAAYSGTGKTTLLTKLIPILKQAGIRVGLIKHSHHNFEIDKPGKDSYTLRQAGATPVMLVSSHRRAVITEFLEIKEPKLNEQLQFFDQSGLDLILVEGFKSEAIPKIEIHRPSLNYNLMFTLDSNVIAFATDDKLKITVKNSGLSLENIPNLIVPPLLDMNNPQIIADFIRYKFLGIIND